MSSHAGHAIEHGPRRTSWDHWVSWSKDTVIYVIYRDHTGGSSGAHVLKTHLGDSLLLLLGFIGDVERGTAIDGLGSGAVDVNAKTGRATGFGHANESGATSAWGSFVIITGLQKLFSETLNYIDCQDGHHNEQRNILHDTSTRKFNWVSKATCSKERLGGGGRCARSP